MHRIDLPPTSDHISALGDFLSNNRVCALSLNLAARRPTARYNNGNQNQKNTAIISVHNTINDTAARDIAKMMLLQDKQGFHSINLSFNNFSVFGVCLLALAAGYAPHLYPDLRGGAGEVRRRVFEIGII